MIETLAHSIAAGSRAFDAVEMQLVRRRRVAAEVEGGDIASMQNADTADVHVRVFAGGRVMVFSLPASDTDALAAMLERAGQEISMLPPDADNLPPEDAGSGSGLTMDDDLFATITADRIKDLAFDIEAAAYTEDTRVSRVRKATFEKERIIVDLLDVHGRTRSYTKTIYTASVEVMAHQNGEHEAGYDAHSVTRATDIDVARVGKTAARRAAEQLGAKALATGNYRILMAADVAAEFIDLVGSLVNGEDVLKQRSILSGRVGQMIASPCFTLVDDASHEGIGAYPFDDEGTPGSRTVLFDKGQLSGLLHNAYTARCLGMKNTGNADRSGSGVMGVAPSTLIVQPGNAPAWDGVGSVLHVRQVMGMHTADPVSGDFSVGIAGSLWENGRPVAPFREMVLSGNLEDLLGRIVGVGDVSRDFGGIVTPDILLDAMSVGGR